jgi:hypothetical protein
MDSNVKTKVLCIGGTGAQGRPVVQGLEQSTMIMERCTDTATELIKDGKYSVIILSRDANSPEAVALTRANPEVSIFVGSMFDEKALHDAFSGVDACFVNTNGFPIGEAKEVFWGIRIFEIAREMGVKHFVYSSLDYALKLGGYDPKFRCGHLDGKGKVSGKWTTQIYFSNGADECCRVYHEPANFADGVVHNQQWPVLGGSGRYMGTLQRFRRHSCVRLSARGRCITADLFGGLRPIRQVAVRHA